MIVLSLFDGLSVGQLALSELGIPVKKYYASEIDKRVIENTQRNFPNTVQLGDITSWETWDIDFSEVDLVIGGSPCTDLSFAGKMRGFATKSGKQITTLAEYHESGGADNMVGQSHLFWVYLDILKHVKDVNPDVKFLLENVRMKDVHSEVMTDAINDIGFEITAPHHINSSIFVPQNRERLYWTNLKVPPLPKRDMTKTFSDIIEDGETDAYVYTVGGTEWIEKMEERKRKHKSYVKGENSSKIIFRCIDASFGKSYSNQRNFSIINDTGEKRFISSVECARLQGLPDDYTESMSRTAAMRAIGNSWTLPVIKHLFSSLKN